jgi:Tfp pilus assembly protein PilE
VDIWLVGLVIVVVVLAIVIRREPDSLERALDETKSSSGRAELNNNAERSRNLPPPPTI